MIKLLVFLQDEDAEAILAADFEIGHFIRERIVPRAVLYFTGEAIEDDDDDVSLAGQFTLFAFNSNECCRLLCVCYSCRENVLNYHVCVFSMMKRERRQMMR